MKSSYLNLAFCLLGFPIHLDITIEGWPVQLMITVGPERAEGQTDTKVTSR
jgi:hypothetical protein